MRTRSANEPAGWCANFLTAHREVELREWADNNPPTFGDNCTLWCRLRSPASIKAIADALQLYEQAIRLGMSTAFVSKRGVGSRLAGAVLPCARSWKRRLRPLRNARELYDRWVRTAR